MQRLLRQDEGAGLSHCFDFSESDRLRTVAFLRSVPVVRVRIEGERQLIFGDVVVRVNPAFRLAMHIDTDEGNAGNIQTGMLGYIEEIQNRG